MRTTLINPPLNHSFETLQTWLTSRAEIRASRSAKRGGSTVELVEWIHLPTRRNERLLGRVCVTYSAYDGANRDQAAGKPVLLAEPERHLLRVAVI